ncbi:META domain-containing protein [Rhabdothermincola salaria]|uniref:META domain-containing protein n=1 Tax=Rhabdothermincola salaria TaxID=2903142 RepID=UPI001E449C73|nr:META domain-containing protein [Rhabdothermincola salaria]MCD9625202.1 META domain-containing protein [Rhabdothermincola salaria]
MRRPLLITLALMSLLAATACGDGSSNNNSGSSSAADPAPGAPADEVIGSTYLGESIEVDGAPVAVPGGGTFEITFAGPDGPAAGTVRAHAVCNHFGGHYTLDGDQLAVEGWGTTEMACEPPAEEFDSLVKELLTDARLSLDGDTLTVEADSEGRTLRAVLTDAEVLDPSAPVEGTTWLLEGILDDEMATAVPIDTGPVTMTLEGGFLSVDTGCNGVGGDYVLEDDTLTVTVGPSTEMWCGGAVDELEGRLRELFSQPLEVRTERRRDAGTLLSLLDATGQGALFGAEHTAEG